MSDSENVSQTGTKGVFDNFWPSAQANNADRDLTNVFLVLYLKNSGYDNNGLPLGHHTLGIECKGVLSTGVHRMLVGNRVGVGLTRSTIKSFAPI